jgi:hypothetical protein
MLYLCIIHFINLINFIMMKNYFNSLAIITIGLLINQNVQSQNLIQGGDCSVAAQQKWTVGWRGSSDNLIEWGNSTVPTDAQSSTSVKIGYGNSAWGEIVVWQKVTLEKDAEYEVTAMVKTTDNDHQWKWAQCFIVKPGVDPDVNDGTNGENAFSDNALGNGNSTKLLSIPYGNGNSEVFSLDGPFPRTDDDGSELPSTYTAESAGEYTVLFKFGGADPQKIIYMTDISLVKKGATGINDTGTNRLSIYPTITQNALYFRGIQRSADVTIYNVSGGVVAIYHDVAQQISISNISSGMYFVKVVDGAETVVKKIIIN